MKAGTMKDGMGIVMSFADFGDLFLHLDPTSITSPGVDGGDAIDNTTLTNSAWRTKTAKALIEYTNASFTAAYDPAAYSQAILAVNVNNAITVTFPDGSSIQFYGYLKSFTPGEMTEGEQPTAECE